MSSATSLKMKFYEGQNVLFLDGNPFDGIAYHQEPEIGVVVRVADHLIEVKTSAYTRTIHGWSANNATWTTKKSYLESKIKDAQNKIDLLKLRINEFQDTINKTQQELEVL